MGGKKKSFSHLPLKRYDLTLKFFYLNDSMMQWAVLFVVKHVGVNITVVM